MLDFLWENKGCVLFVAFIVFVVLYVVGRPGNFQSLITKSNDNLIVTEVNVIDVLRVDPHDVNATIEKMANKISKISKLETKKAEDLVVEGPLIGEFKGGLAYVEVLGSQVDWLSPGDKLLVFTCSVYYYPAQSRDCFEIPDQDTLYMDYPPNVRGVIDGRGNFRQLDSSDLSKDSNFEGMILVADVSLREAGFLDPEFEKK